MNITKEVSDEMYRATFLLQLAAEYIRDYCPENTVHYDEAECDGYCLADDCETASNTMVMILSTVCPRQHASD